MIMGTEARLVLYAPDEPTARAAATAAFARLVALDDALSDWRDDNELAAVVAAAGAAPVPVGPDLLEVLQRSRQLARATDGAFDPTVAPVVALWRAARESGAPPDPEALAQAAARVGYIGLVVDGEAGTAWLERPGMGLDLGACAKGWAAAQALAVLAEQGCPASLVDLGGDLAVGEPPPGRTGWRVAAGCSLPGRAPRVLTLSHRVVASSGSTEQHLDLDGRRLSHVIDPRSGEALVDAPCVTVVAGDGLLADGLASALMVMGAGPGRALLAERWPELSVFFDDARREPLFDGESLDGWVTTGGRYDGRARWTVQDGVILGRTAEDGAGGLLYTAARYADFELELDVWLDHPFDSGVFVRMLPPGDGRGGQITLDDRPGGEIGGVYSDGWLAHQPLGTRVWRRDTWNHVRVRCEGDDQHLMAWVNGSLVMDQRLPPGATGFAASGHIGLQVHGGGSDSGHGGRARFREITLIELQ